MKIGFIKNHVIGGISLVKVGINVVQQKISISAMETKVGLKPKI